MKRKNHLFKVIVKRTLEKGLIFLILALISLGFIIVAFVRER
jgi:hypothetical protein